MIKHIMPLIILTLMFGCTIKNNNKSLNSAYFIENYNKKFKADEIVDTNSYKFIRLETNKESVFGTISKLLIDSDRIFILDERYAKKVFVFDMNGKFISTVGAQGKGPNEYLKVQDIDIDIKNKQLILYDAGLRKLLFYSYNGDFIKKLELSSYAGMTFSFINPNRFAFFLHAPHETSSKTNQLLFYSEKGGLIEEKIPFTRFAFDYINKSYFSRNGDLVYFIPEFYDRIYSIDKKMRTTQVFDLHLSDLMITDEDKMLNKNKGSEEILKLSKITPFNNFVASGSHFCCWTIYKNQPVGIIGDMKTKKIIVGDYMFGAAKGMPDKVLTTYNDYFVSSFYPIVYKEKFYPDATMEDNQGVHLFKFKDINNY